MPRQRRRLAHQMTHIAACVALLTVCSWITVPFTVSFTMQVFAVFLIALLSDWRSSLCSVLLYLLLGICGLPVFAGFMAGPAALFRVTGGYLLGFLICAPVISKLCERFRDRTALLLLFMGASLALCYALGTLWFMLIYTDQSLLGAICICVLPFLFFDILKILLALLIAKRIRPYLLRSGRSDVQT